MTVLNQEKLGEYNNFLNDFRKELKAILKKVKKGFGHHRDRGHQLHFRFG